MMTVSALEGYGKNHAGHRVKSLLTFLPTTTLSGGCHPVLLMKKEIEAVKG